MKVYCLIGDVDYEGNDLLGVYLNREKAKEEADRLNSLPKGKTIYDYVGIQEMDVIE